MAFGPFPAFLLVSWYPAQTLFSVVKLSPFKVSRPAVTTDNQIPFSVRVACRRLKEKPNGGRRAEVFERRGAVKGAGDRVFAPGQHRSANKRGECCDQRPSRSSRGQRIVA